jgi:hypothetical protein
MNMEQAERLLDQQLVGHGLKPLKHGGVVRTDEARQHAHEQYQIFNEKRKLSRQAEADETIAALRKHEKSLSNGGGRK